MPLPPGVNPEEIEAEYKDGILEVSIPMPPEKESKTVRIKPRPRE
jgi:HSP20 family molecular chaperone IbpA